MRPSDLFDFAFTHLIEAISRRHGGRAAAFHVRSRVARASKVDQTITSRPGGDPPPSIHGALNFVVGPFFFFRFPLSHRSTTTPLLFLEVTRHRHKRAVCQRPTTNVGTCCQPFDGRAIILVPFQCRDSKGTREYSAVSRYVLRSTVPAIDVCEGSRITAIEQSKDKRSFQAPTTRRAR